MKHNQYQIEDLLRGWSAELSASGRRPGTIALRISHARRLFEHLGGDVRRFTRDEIITWIAAQETWAPATKASARASIRTLGAYLQITGVIERDPTRSLPTVRMPRTVPKIAPDEVILDTICSTDGRVRLMLELMARCGLRRGEVAALRGDDVSHTRDGWVLRIVGKGGHERIVPCPPDIGVQLNPIQGWVFPGADHGHLSAAHVGKLVSRALPAGITGHRLRARYATSAYAATHDLRAVQELLGHAKIETTRAYVGVSAAAIEAAARGAWNFTGQ